MFVCFDKFAASVDTVIALKILVAWHIPRSNLPKAGRSISRAKAIEKTSRKAFGSIFRLILMCNLKLPVQPEGTT